MRTRVVLLLTVLLVPELVIRPRGAVAVTPPPPLAQANALWEPPTNLRDRDLYYGPWGARLQPDSHAVYTFVRRKTNGTNPGVIVRDAQGREWHVKQGKGSGLHSEGPVEVVVSRVLSAMGYHQPPVYYLPSFTMRDGKNTHSEPGGRFRLDEPSLREAGNWSWDDPAVKGSRPYNGLLVILLAFASWDLKESNNHIYEVQRNGHPEIWYMVRDLGAALGDEGRLRATRNDIGKFEQQGFIRGLSNGYVDFDYDGKRGDLYRRRITVEDVRWATSLLGSLDDRQLREAFRAGGYSSEASDRFIRKIKANILEGQRLAANPRTLARANW
jgi:hypothetical protein